VTTDRSAEDRYGDLMGDEPGPALHRTVSALDVLAGAAAPSPHLSARIDRALQNDGSGRGPRWWKRRVVAPVTVLLVAAALAGGVIAANNILNLGKPTSATSTDSYFPLDGFHHTGETLRSHNKVDLLFIGASGSYYRLDAIAMERWPVAKVLEQFGALSDVRAVPSACTTYPSGTGSPYVGRWCSAPTYDFSHARYHSKYVSFSNNDILRYIGEKAKLFQRLGTTAHRIFTRYVKYRGTPQCTRSVAGQIQLYPCKGLLHALEESAFGGGARTLPLIDVGGYVQTVSQDLDHGAFARQDQVDAATPLPAGHQLIEEHELTFNQIQRALMSGHEPAPTSNLVAAINAEANIITALICHADGGRPSSVCGRPVVKQIAKYVK
jgi:hypothetical protein